ncbi:MAG: glycosyltransferase family 4 protein [Alphaproteobacteria bacterium]|nr:glycosyltransferase family 4 protein [Alphaproteobacteria bacterium]
MKILFPFVGDHVGGSHIASLLLIKNLTKPEFEPVIVLHQDGLLARHLEQNHVEFTILPPSSSLTNFLNEQKIDIVHTNDWRMHYKWIFPAFFAKRAKHIWHQHSQSSSWRLAVLSFFTDKALTVSRYCKDTFPPFFKDKAEIVYNPFEIKALDNKNTLIRKELGLNEDTKIIGFVGNLTHQKRPDFFIDLARHVHSHPKNKHDFHFVLIGEKRSPLYEELDERIKNYKLENYIHFLGPKFPVEPYVSELDVLIAPAQNEGLGRAPIEAMLHETPVIASNDGGHKEIIQHGKTGFLIEKNDLEGFSQAVFEIINNPEKTEKIVKQAKDDAVNSFSAQTHSQHLKKIYQSLHSK